MLLVAGYLRWSLYPVCGWGGKQRLGGGDDLGAIGGFPPVQRSSKVVVFGLLSLFYPCVCLCPMHQSQDSLCLPIRNQVDRYLV
jgi:hypothetical protein